MCRSQLGAKAARTIERIIRPRGSKGGRRHKPKPQRIDTIVSYSRQTTESIVRPPSTLVQVPILPPNICKVRLNDALWNSRSLSNKVGGLASIILQDKLDFVLLTETLLKSHSDPVVSELLSAVSGYCVHNLPRANRRGGGVAVVSRSNLALMSKKAHSFRSFECL